MAKVLLIPAHSKQNIIPALEASLSHLENYKNIGIATTVQFINQLDKARDFFEKNGKKALVGKPHLHAIREGQLLGCDATALLNIQNQVDCFVYIGTGEFHPLAVELNTDLPVFKVNPFTKQVTQITVEEKKLWLKKKLLRIEKAKQAKVLGLLVTIKPGQNQMQGLVKNIVDKLEKQGKKAYIFIADTISPNELLNYPQIEAWVNTACPRMVDDQELYNRPIVNVSEIFS